MLQFLEVRENSTSLKDLGCLAAEDDYIAPLFESAGVNLIGTGLLLVDSDTPTLLVEANCSHIGRGPVAHDSSSHSK